MTEIRKQQSDGTAVTYIIANNEITFSAEAMYEIYDTNGNIVLRGFSAKVSIAGLKAGGYYMNYDSFSADFRKA